MGPGAAVGDPHQAGVALAIDPQRLAPRRLAIGKSEAHVAVRPAADVPGGQHQAIRRDDHPAAAAGADFHRHHCGRHARGQRFDVPLDGPEVGEGGWHVLGERGGQVRAASGGRSWQRRQGYGVSVGRLFRCALLTERAGRLVWAGFGEADGGAEAAACASDAASTTASNPHAGFARKNSTAPMKLKCYRPGSEHAMIVVTPDLVVPHAQ